MNEATSEPVTLQQETTTTTTTTTTASGSPSASESGMELGLNSWFPAYGFHAPQMQLQIHSASHYQPNFQPTHEDPRSNDALLVRQVEFLETILEETSDDLQSDSDRSGTAYWLGSDSETESVIHVRARHAEEKLDGSGSECNSVVPKKRRRKNGVEGDEDAVMMYDDNGDEEDEEFSSSSRSSSLLQFETLERNCATTCRDSPSSYSFDSLDFANRRPNGNFGNTSPDSLEGRSLDSDTIVTNGTSNHVGERLANGVQGKIRPYRSFESLETCQKLEDHRLVNGGFAIYATNEKHRNLRLAGEYSDDEYDYDDDDEEEEEDYDDVGLGRRLSARDRDFWQGENGGDISEFNCKKFEDRLGFAEIPSGYSTSMDRRNIIDLREIGIETKRDAVLELRSGQTLGSAALLQSRINIASGMGRGGGGGSCGGQQGWSEQGFNFRFTDKSQSVPSLASDVSTHGAATRRCSISPSQLHFEAQDFENFVQVSSVPVGLHLCGLAAQNVFRSTSEEPGVADHEMAELPGCEEEATSPSSLEEEPKRQVTSTVRTQDRAETNLVLVPVPMTDLQVDSIVDEAIRRLEREDEARKPQETGQQRPRRVKNNASYELAQHFEVEDFARRLPVPEGDAEVPKPTPRRRVRNNASYELAQQFDYVRAFSGQRTFQRMDACDELEEPGTSGLKVTDLVEEMTKSFAGTGSETNLTTANGFGPPEAKVYSKSSENVASDRGRSVPVSENHVQGHGKISEAKKKAGNAMLFNRDENVEGESLLSQIKKNLDSFSTCGESASAQKFDDEPDLPYFENKSIAATVTDHHHHHHHHHDHHHNPNSNNQTDENSQEINQSEDSEGESKSAATNRENEDEGHVEEEDEEDEEREEVEVRVRGEKRRLKLNVNAASDYLGNSGGNCGAGGNVVADMFITGKPSSLESSSSRSVSSTPNLHKMSFISEFYPEQNVTTTPTSATMTNPVHQSSGGICCNDDPFVDDIDEGIGSVKDYDRLFLHGSVRSESAIGMTRFSMDGAAGRSEADDHRRDDAGVGIGTGSSSDRNTERRSRAGSSTTSGNTSLGEGSTASEWPQRPETDNVYPPLLQTQASEPLQRITSLKRSGTVEAKQTQSNATSYTGVTTRDMSSKLSSSGVSAVHQHQQDTTGSGKIQQEKKKGLGGFLQRFSRLRFSGRSKVPRSELVKKSASAAESRPNNVNKVQSKSVTDNRQTNEPEYVIIPLHGPGDEERNDHPAVVESASPENTGKSTDVQRSGSNLSSNSRSAISSKPPLPPQPPRAGALTARPPSGVGTRRRAATDLGSPTAIEMAKARAMQAGSERPVGLLETDLDAADVADASVDHQVGVATPAASNNKKTRSLLNLNHSRAVPGGRNVLHAPQSPGGTNVEGAVSCGHQRPHKSMEFLLDKENLHFVKPPENELQKVGERVPSEHELRVQRSLQRLNVPEWYKNSPAARDGFRLKRHSDASQHGGWRTLGSKTTSLSSLSSSNKPPPGPLLSPSPTPPVFSRWSTSLLNSAGSSPASSARSSFNHRQPYLGWRSQERLSNPRTPAERLAQGILPNVPPTSKKQATSFGPAQQLEVRNSIKEVTSAIVHYVQSGQEVNGGRLSPRPENWEGRGGARSTSPRGNVKLCWMESSFVGMRPVDSPKTPITLTTDVECCAVCNSTLNEPCTCIDNAVSGLFLDLTPDDGQRMSPSPSSHHHHHHPHHRGSGSGHSETEEAMAAAALLRNKPSPGSTTLEDVLDSLLGLPPASRTPSPGPGPTRRSTAAGKSCSTLRQDLQESASTMLEADQLGDSTPSYFAQGGQLQTRRKSEGSDSLPPRNAATSSSLRNRRVSFDNAQESPENTNHHHHHHHQHQQQHQQQQQQQQQQHDRTTVRCRYGKCTNSTSAGEARRSYKTCHNCSYAYCSRECRRAHWERHRRTCLYSRAGTLCRQVLSSAKQDGHSLQHVSNLARRGYASHGRGAVKCFFTSPESAEKFISNGFIDLGEPIYVRWSDLLPSEMGTELHAELMRLCKSYNPETRLVLYVAVCVVSEVPTSGAVKWERQLVSKCAKVRLAGCCRELTTSGNTQQPQRQSSPCNITRDMDSPETLVLTSFPGSNGQNTPQRAREISFTNIQRQLRLRGVSLRRHFPQVYKKLCSYVDGSVDKFAPVTIYPRDQASGKSFMCIIMLDAEPERLQLLPTDSSRVRTVDISIEQE
ncbi:uncharacterized protein LOC124300917 isoform X2 [Neodiprion virginianus]|nr:uncharacterized protein LOC124300917 isoform X2 [Neodiprion virginianus]